MKCDATDPVPLTTVVARGCSSGDRRVLSPGDRVGDYVVASLLGQGGAGAVYRVVPAERGGAARALKVLHADLVSSHEAALRFAREVRAIGRIRHPNVIAVHEVGELPDGNPYFTMELLDGVDLRAHLAAAGRLSLDETLSILDPLAAALSAAHAQAIVHRDIKPSNVFLADEGGARRVVLLDFGVAKLLDDSGPAITGSRQMVGTPAFMAPEQIRGLPTDQRTDVYALGALVYALLTGEPPFPATSTLLPQLHLHARPPRPSARAPVEPAIDEVVLRALSKDPGRRQQGAAALLAELREAAGRAGLPSGAERLAVALHVEAHADAAALEDAEPGLLDDLEAILPAAQAWLAERGFRVAVEAGHAALYVVDPGGFPGGERAARRSAIDAARALLGALEARPARDPRVHVALCLHAAPARFDGGAPAGGPLLDVAAWLPEGLPAGLFATPALLDLATPALLDGLGLEAAPAGAVARLCARALPAITMRR
ncbi:serine/threonine-protein kinase [Sorangium sp. So ce381]|uniref:serine/threonine-protein kinase n=1 Tax=Sorangium sp. So ce381 TaxID=3133307 RepID=UPI003F5B6A55